MRAMNKWAMYWMLHCVGISGMAATLIALPYGWLPGYAMGGIGGGWMAGFMCLARWLVMRSEPPNVRGNAPTRAERTDDEQH